MSVREKAFIQRFYLYLIMTKTSEKLYITYARNGMDMKAVLPSYIIRMIKKMFPLVKEYAREDTFAEHAYIRIPKADIVWSEVNLNKVLAEGIALELYGRELTGSVTSLNSSLRASSHISASMDLGLKRGKNISLRLMTLVQFFTL